MSLQTASIPHLQDLAIRAANRIARLDRGEPAPTPRSRQDAEEVLARVTAELERRGAKVPGSARRVLLSAG